MNPALIKILLSLLIQVLKMLYAKYDSMTEAQKREFEVAIKNIPRDDLGRTPFESANLP